MITYPHFCICLFINLNYLPLYLNTYSPLINFNVVQLNAGLTLFLFAFVGKINYIIIVFRARCNSSPAVTACELCFFAKPIRCNSEADGHSPDGRRKTHDLLFCACNFCGRFCLSYLLEKG